MSDALTIVNAALLKLGASTIASFEDETAEAELARILYGTTRDVLLVAHPWRFAEAEADLAKDATAVSEDFENSFRLPIDYLSLRSINWPPGIVFKIAGRSVCTDAATVRARYTRRPPEQWFPPHFEQALIMRLAAELALPLTEQDSRAQSMASLANYELRQAKLLDGQQDTPKAFEDFTLVSCR